jgi:type IV pilus assembly protein PilB
MTGNQQAAVLPKQKSTDQRSGAASQQSPLLRRILKDDLFKRVRQELLEENGSVTQHEVLDRLVSKYNLDRHKLYSTIAQVYAFRIINFDANELTKEQISFIRNLYLKYSENVRKKLIEYKVLPFKQHDSNKNIVVFVSSNPFMREIENFIRKNDHLVQYEIAYAKEDDVNSLISKVLHSDNEYLQQVEESAELVDMEADESTSESDDEGSLDAEINRSMLTNLIEGMLVEAVRKKASDVHLVPQSGTMTKIYFRIDGKLQLWHKVEATKPEAVSAVVKDRSMNVDRFDRSSAQDGFIQRTIDGAYIRFRVSVIPIVSREFARKLESIVIRVLDDRKVIADLTKLGLQEQAENDFRKAISLPHGMIILTGPTGSGKSTTLVAAIQTVKDETKNVVTVEEPVEYLINGARQIRLGEKLDFESALRSILRHDPDIVMVGEMRDARSAAIGVSLANTGHLTFSTLHTNDAPSAVSRLYMLGVEPFLIANALSLIMAQRLVRKLCPHCKSPASPKELEMAVHIGMTQEEIESTTVYTAVGCKQCFEGYQGRVAILEALLMDQDIRKIILSSNDGIDEEAIRKACSDKGMLTLMSSGKARILEGLTTINEIISATQEI